MIYGMSNRQHDIFIERYALRSDMPLAEGARAFIKKDDGTVTGLVVDTESGLKLRTDDAKLLEIDKATALEETEEIQMNRRISRAVAMREPQEKRAEWEKKFMWLLEGRHFIPSGRTLASAGTQSPMPYYNGYVIPSPKDDTVNSAAAMSVIASVMEYGGGIGMNISTIRPKSMNGYGTLEWAEMYSSAAALFGKDRGVLMLCIDVWHPEIVRILKARKDGLVNVNLAVCINDEFMEAVRTRRKWETVFPDTTCEEYRQEWTGDIASWKQKDLPLKKVEEFNATELWNLIVEQIRLCGEPGLIFTDTCRKMTGEHIKASNPWMEQCLPEWGVMNLGALNLASFVKAGNIDMKDLTKAVGYAVRFLDDCVDDTPYPLEENRRRQKNERRLGLGVMGLAEMLVTMDVRYGSKDALSVVDTVFSTIAETSFSASCDIAEEKGPYGSLSRHDFLNSEFVKALPESIRERIGRNGIRNRTLMAQAPTGMTSAYAGTTNGIDPFADSRRIEQISGESGQEWTVTRKDITPMEMADMLCAMQRHMDGAISEVIEVPENYERKDLSDLIIHMYVNGCKTVAIHRRGTPDIRITARSGNAKKTSDTKAQEETIADLKQRLKTARESNVKLAQLVNGSIRRSSTGEETLKERQRSDEMIGVTMRRETPCGTAYVTINCDSDNDIFEVFAQVGKAGSDVSADAESICRLISLALRMPSPYTPEERARAVIEQLKGIGSGSRSPGISRSLADAIASTMESFLERKRKEEEE